MKEELEYYYQSIFDEAELYSRARNFLLFGMLCLLSLSVYSEEKYLYFLILGIFIVQFLLWGLTQKITGLYNLGHSFQKQSMLSDLSINTMDVATLDSQKQKVSAYVKKKVKEKKKNQSNNSKKPIKKIILHAARLRRLVHENVYFNHHLFEKSYQRNIKILGGFFALIAISILLFIPHFQVNSDLSSLRLVYTLLSFGLLYEFLTSTLRYRATKEEMKNIDIYLTQAPEAIESVLLEAFTRYSEAKILTPNIPNGIYEEHDDSLNEGWKSRQIKVISEVCNKLGDINEPWAITGGANHYLRGVVKILNDVDIITTKKGGELISEILKEYTAREYKFNTCSTIKSYFGIFDYRSLQFEIMADPTNLIKNSWEENNEWKNQIEHVSFNGYTLPLTTIEYEIYIYRKIENTSKEKELTAFKNGLTSHSTGSQPIPQAPGAATG